VLHFLSVISCNKTGVLQWLAGVLFALLQSQRNQNKEGYRGVFLLFISSSSSRFGGNHSLEKED
jgi:hypothetical protein